MPSVIFYAYRDGLYVNLTNRCPTACVFCIKSRWEWSYRGQDLLLRSEPELPEILALLDERLQREPRELVFCGYGEPTERLDAVLAVAARARRLRPTLALRMNTVGLGSMIHGRDIVPDLRAALDAVSVSLNTADAAQWRTLMRPQSRFSQKGFEAVCAFISGCAAAGLRTTATALEREGVDLDAVAALAVSLGAGFRRRPLLENEEPAAP